MELNLLESIIEVGAAIESEAEAARMMANAEEYFICLGVSSSGLLGMNDRMEEEAKTFGLFICFGMEPHSNLICLISVYCCSLKGGCCGQLWRPSLKFFTKCRRLV